MEFSVDKASNGARFIVHSVAGTGQLRKRLVDLGFVSGARGVVLRRGLFGGPILLKLGRARVALREDEARLLHVGPDHG